MGSDLIERAVRHAYGEAEIDDDLGAAWAASAVRMAIRAAAEYVMEQMGKAILLEVEHLDMIEDNWTPPEEELRARLRDIAKCLREIAMGGTDGE